MTTIRLLSGAFLIGLTAFSVGCGSDTKTTPANPWAGRTYLLDIPDNRWKQPKESGSELGPSVPKFLLSVSGAGSNLDVLIGTADDDGKQDMCGTTTMLSATSPYPNITIGPGVAKVRIGDKVHVNPIIATAYGFTMTNILAETSDASPVDTSEFTATIDAREIYSIFWQQTNASPDSVCNALASFSAECGPCPNDQGPYCLTMKAVALVAAPVNGTEVQPVAEADIDDDACAVTVADGGA